jgi:thioredoxin reductase
VGDVVAGLDQIVTAFGQAAIAATAIRNELAG